MTLMKGVFEPGWRWSADVAPIAGTTSCQARHLGYVISGRMQVRLDDGTEFTSQPGDLFDLPAGHDAWVIGDEPCIMIDTSPDVIRYARGDATTPADDKYMALVRTGYDAFNRGDADTLRRIMSHDVVHYAPGNSQVSGSHKGIDAVLAYYAKLGELTDGQFRCDLINVFGDGQGHVTSMHQVTATRNGVTRVSRGTILFTFVGDRATELLEMLEDLPGDNAFFA